MTKTLQTLLALSLLTLSSVASAQDFQTRANPYLVPHCKTAQECVERYTATMALVKEGTAALQECKAGCDPLNRTTGQLLTSAQHLSDRADELEASEKKEAQVAGDSGAWQMAASWEICGSQAAIQESQALMGEQAQMERASGVIDLRERRSIGRDIVNSQARITAAKKYLAKHKMKALPCAQVYQDSKTLPENVQAILNTTDVFFHAE